MTAAVPPAGPDHSTASKLFGASRSASRWVIAIGGAIVIFGVLMLTKSANPIDAYHSMVSTITTETSLTAILVKGAPLVLAALAVTVPARAGLVNVGGEGQLLMGGIFGAGMAMMLGTSLPGWLVLVALCVAGMIGGALWAAIAALLRQWSGISEAVSTLLLNYVALNILYFLIYSPWKDPHGSGQPATKPLPVAQRLPLLGTSKVNAGIVLALLATAVVGFVLSRTRLGFQFRVVGGNAEAARRAGLRVGGLVFSAMLIGGALAGLGGAAWLAGTEFKLRPGFLVTYGYIGFLASWLARHRPWRVAGAAVLLAAISISGDSLQLDSALPAATVNILMALLLLAMFGFSTKRLVAA